MVDRPQAVILAAGLGTRLGGLTEACPKCLLDVGGRPLIAHSLDNLAAAGFDEALVVTGFRAGDIERTIGTHHGRMAVRYVHNPDYAATGSVVSLLVGATAIDAGPLLILESDILYHPDFIAVARVADRNLMLVADPTGSGDEVYVATDSAGRLAHLGKQVPRAVRRNSLGEFAGITRLDRAFLGRYCQAAGRLVKHAAASGHYEELVFDLAGAEMPVFARHCPGLPWTEVDTAADLARAREQVFPALETVA